MKRMLILSGLAIALLPAVLRAQDTTNQQMQDMQQRQQQPGVMRSAAPGNMQDSNAVPGTTGQEMKDKMFLRKAAQGGLAEVKLGQLAADKGASDEVKQFGSRMVTDHTMLNDEMKPIADSDGIRLPKEMSKEDQAQYEKLSALSGDDFDKAYVLGMVKDHRKDLREFREEAESTNDAALKAAVEKGEGVIREHMKMIAKIAREKGYMPPGGHQPTPPAAPTQ